MGMGCLGKALDVQDCQSRIGQCLSKNCLGIRAEGCFQLGVRTARGHKRKVYPHALHGDSEKIVGTTIDGGGSYHMVPASGDIENSKKVCRLSRGGEHGGRASLQGAEFGRHGIVSRVLEPGIKIALRL